MKRRVPAWLGLAGLCLALIASATPAGAAAPADGSVTADGGPRFTSAPTLVAGYLAAPAGGLATAALRLKVPSVKCADEARAVTIGLGDVQDLESPRLRAHVLLSCPAEGPAEYSLAAQACSQSAGPLATKRGHRITVALAQGGGTVTMTVTDRHTGTTVSATDSTANCDPSGTIDSVLFGAFPVFAPTLMDVPTFNKVKSRDTTVNGADLRGEKLDRQTEPGITTSKLKSLDGNLTAGSKKSGDSFALRYRNIVHCCLRFAAPAGPARRAV